MGTVMNTEFGRQDGERQEQQQQGSEPDLAHRYQAIGIPALNAATLCKPAKKPASPPQQQAMIVEYED